MMQLEDFVSKLVHGEMPVLIGQTWLELGRWSWEDRIATAEAHCKGNPGVDNRSHIVM